MNDLITRLEAATGPDRELDGAIFWFAKRAQAVRYFHNAAVGKPSQSLPDELPPHGLGRHAVVQFSPRYTASIDAAITLVPEGFQAYVDTGVGHGDAHACAWTDHPHRIQGGARQQATPAIALCIAALKARAEQQDAPIAGQQERQTK